MLFNIIKLTPEVGIIISLTLFILMVSITYYRYYKSVFRLVYSRGTVCTTCENLGDFNKNGNVYKTRIIFYNNGRKTISKKVIPFLSIESKTQEIISANILKNEIAKLNLSKEKIFIDIDYLDSNSFIVVEVEHKGIIEIKG